MKTNRNSRREEAVTAVAGFITGRQRFLLLAHQNPDGDALGSVLALGEGLASMGKTVTMFCQSGVADMFTFLPGADRIVTDIGRPGDYDAALLLDHHGLERAGEKAMALAGRVPLAVIDHHQVESELPDYALVDSGVSAAGELVLHLLQKLGASVTPDMATNLFAALSTDTGSFSYSNTTPGCLKAAADLVRVGARPWEIFRNLHLGRPAARLHLLGLALNSIEFHDSGRIGAITVTTDMMAATGTDSSDTDGFVEYPRSVVGVELAILFRETAPNGCKVSLRSLGRVNAADLARTFGGGGHAQAAGFSSIETLERVKTEVFRRSLDFLPPHGEDAGAT